MSNLTDNIQKALENSICEFCTRLSEKYNISKKELFDIWHGEECSPQKDEKEENELERIVNAQKPELVALCKKYSIKTSGKKEDLVKRLLNFKENGEQPKPKATTKKAIPAEKPVLKQSVIPTIQISRNKHGNYEHNETGLVFSKNDKIVIGKQASDGKILDLTKDDIELCSQYKFRYKMPENLSKGKDMNVKIAEIDDDDEDDDEDPVSEDEDDLDEFYGSD